MFGGSGWTQRASFVVTGLLILAFAFGLRAALRRYGAGVWAALLIGLFAPDRTTHGVLHDIFGTPVFLGLPVACLVVAYRFTKSGHPAWAGYSVATAVAFLTGFVVTSMGFAQNPTLMPIGGLLQRITIVIGWAWLTALALYLLRRSQEDG